MIKIPNVYILGVADAMFVIVMLRQFLINTLCLNAQEAILKVSRLDHLVLTVRDIGQTVRFYESVLGMEKEEFGEGRVALRFANQKINLHQAGREFEPKADRPAPGSADLCFITDTDLDSAMRHVKDQGIEVIEGPVRRTGAKGPIISFYFRDPDKNLIEVSNYI